MGPQPFGCGRINALDNIAAANLLQWGRNLSVAEGKPWEAALAAMRRFNGAATFRLRKGHAGITFGYVNAASMGPQPFGCGRSDASRCRSSSPRCFNGAATFRLRKARCQPQTRRGCLCFNGAATFRLRKAARLAPSGMARGSFNGAATFRLRKGGLGVKIFCSNAALQWGRNLSVAEGLPLTVAVWATGTLQWGRNLSVAEGGTWRQAPGRMGMLQWGRNLSVAEGWPARLHRYFSAFASMGPQPFGCGRAVPSMAISLGF